MKKLQIIRATPDRNKLKRFYLKEKDSRLKERYQAMYLMREFKNARDVANFLCKDKKTILTWIKAFNDRGVDGLVRDSPPGRPPRLSNEQMEELKLDVCKNPRELGYSFSNWEGKSVSYHIQKKFGIKLGVRATQKMLHRLGFTLQRPKYKLAKSDSKAQEQFRLNLKKEWMLLEKMTLSFLKTNVA